MSKAIDIEDDVYELIRANVRDFRETESSVLRRLLTPNGNSSAPSTVRGRAVGSLSSRPASGLEQKQSGLAEFLSSGAAAARRATDTYLRILAFAHSEKKEDFGKVLDIKGRSRAYFGRSEKDITVCGESTHPQRIPHTDYWALTNASTDHKRAILDMALKRLGYGEADVRAACSALR
jgi:negative modulator of initiation of replication